MLLLWGSIALNLCGREPHSAGNLQWTFQRSSTEGLCAHLQGLQSQLIPTVPASSSPALSRVLSGQVSHSGGEVWKQHFLPSALNFTYCIC